VVQSTDEDRATVERPAARHAMRDRKQAQTRSGFSFGGAGRKRDEPERGGEVNRFIFHPSSNISVMK
jgi:hypothetical protein